jgi:GAF domain-containing protein
LIAALALFAGIDRLRAGQPIATLKPDGASNVVFVVTAAHPGSPLHVGDRVRIDDPAQIAAMSYLALPAGSTLRVVRTAPLPSATIDLAVIPIKQTLLMFLLPRAIQTLFLAIALLVALRGRSAGSLPLAWLFALVTLLVNPTTPAWPKVAILAFAVVAGCFAILAFMCATEFAIAIAGEPNAPWARRIRRSSRALALCSAVYSLAISIGSLRTLETPEWLQQVSLGAAILQAALFLCAVVFANAKAAAADRQRVLWVTASLAVGITGFLGSIVAEAAGVGRPLFYLPLLLLVAMPLGCAYAILRYRLLDIAFVVNRATVFGITSLLVLGALALVDSGLQTLLGSWLIRNGTAVQIAVALVIGIATRPIHERVDGVVDDLFFRRRHEAERELRRFVRDVAYIDDAPTVIARTAQTVAHAANLRCTIFLTGPDGLIVGANTELPLTVDRNDAAIVRLLSTREIVDLREIDTALRGDYAFPMFARNRLLGVLVCGDPDGGVGTGAPDELDAIGAVAHASGVAIDLLRIEALERELAVAPRTPGLSAIRATID